MRNINLRACCRLIGRLPSYLRESIANQNSGAKKPRLLTYTVTFRCNARCIMCDSWKIRESQDLSLKEVESIFQQIGRLDAVRLTGGEPFVRSDLGDIVKLAVKHLRPFGIHITTNGFLTDRIVDLCETREKSMPLQLMISLDGDRDTHNRIRGSSIAFDSVMKTLAELAPRKRELNLDLAINQTIVDADSADSYTRLREITQRFNVRHQTVFAYDTSATYNLNKEIDLAPKQVGEFTSYSSMNREQLTTLFSKLADDCRRLPLLTRWAKSYYLDGIRQRLIHREGVDAAAWVNPPCVALHSHLRIFPNGDVPTCQFNSKTIGNLRHQSFREVWSSQQAQSQREWVRKCPGCWAECEVLPNAIYSLDLLKHRRLASVS